MVDLEPCAKCGKQVLLSRYSWSQRLIICKSCEALNVESLSPSKNIKSAYSNLDNDLLSKDDTLDVKSEGFTSLNKGKFQEEILVTWPSLLKIISLSLLIITLFFLGTNRWNNKEDTIRITPMLEKDALKDY